MNRHDDYSRMKLAAWAGAMAATTFWGLVMLGLETLR